MQRCRMTPKNIVIKDKSKVFFVSLAKAITIIWTCLESSTPKVSVVHKVPASIIISIRSVTSDHIEIDTDDHYGATLIL